MSGGRLVVCPTPIGNLEDVTLRVLSALRDADVVACEDTRRTRVLLERYGVQASLDLLPRAQRSARVRPSWCERMRGGAVVALVSRRGDAAGVRSRLRARRRAASRRGWRSRCCPGRRPRSAALVASALPADAWRFAGFLPRKRGELMRVLRVAGDRWLRSSHRGAWRHRLRVLAELDPGAPGGGLPRADQGARGGRAGDGRRARRALRGRRRRAARWCWSSAERPPRSDRRPERPSTRSAGCVDAGARRAGRGGRGRGVDGRAPRTRCTGRLQRDELGWVRRRRVPAARLTLIRDAAAGVVESANGFRHAWLSQNDSESRRYVRGAARRSVPNGHATRPCRFRANPAPPGDIRQSRAYGRRPMRLLAATAVLALMLAELADAAWHAAGAAVTLIRPFDLGERSVRGGPRTEASTSPRRPGTAVRGAVPPAGWRFAGTRRVERSSRHRAVRPVARDPHAARVDRGRASGATIPERERRSARSLRRRRTCRPPPRRAARRHAGSDTPTRSASSPPAGQPHAPLGPATTTGPPA